jgi:hypothetical protein
MHETALEDLLLFLPVAEGSRMTARCTVGIPPRLLRLMGAILPLPPFPIRILRSNNNNNNNNNNNLFLGWGGMSYHSNSSKVRTTTRAVEVMEEVEVMAGILARDGRVACLGFCARSWWFMMVGMIKIGTGMISMGMMRRRASSEICLLFHWVRSWMEVFGIGVGDCWWSLSLPDGWVV